MRKLLFFTLLVFSVLGTSAQAINLNDSSGVYRAEIIVPVDSLKAEDMFTAAKEWITLNYKSANDVIQLADKDTKKIIFKGNFVTYMYFSKGYIEHTIMLEFKDGRYRLTATDFAYSSPTSSPRGFDKSFTSKKKLISETQGKLQAVIDNLTAYIKKGSGQVKSEW